jgi:uncharacterized protein DUF6134
MSGGTGRSMLAAGVLLLAAVVVRPAAAAERYDYRVHHPSYGDIGSYTNVIDRKGEDTEVRTELKIAIRMLGIVVYHQEARRTERWHGRRLVGFDGVTVVNGRRMEVHGEARDGGFVVTGPEGTVVAPADVHPSNPWSPMVLESDTLMSTRDGRVMRGRVSGGNIEPSSSGSTAAPLRRYEVDSNHRDFVWFDGKGVPVRFQVQENGTPIDFVLAQREVLIGSR